MKSATQTQLWSRSPGRWCAHGSFNGTTTCFVKLMIVNHCKK